MKNECIYLNNTPFTENNIPFQVSDDEEILYFHKNTQFYLRMGNGIPIDTKIYKSSSGYIFLTKYRLIYKVLNSNNNFSSFCLPLKEIVSVSDDHTIEFIYGTFVQCVYLDFGEAQKLVFFKVLQDLLNYNHFEGFKEDSIDELPYYSDLHK